MTPTRRLERLFELSLVSMITAGFAGVAAGGGADPASTTLVLAALLYRAVHAFRPGVPILSRRRGTIVAFAILLFYPCDLAWLSVDFVEPTVRLLCLFTSLQLAMARTGRDYFFLGLLGFLHLLSASMFTADLGFLGLLLLFHVMATSTYATYEVLYGARANSKTADSPAGGHAARYLPVLGVALGCGILGLSAGLFAVLPRPHGVGGYALQGDYGVGFSQQVDLGLIGSLTADPRPVMRIEALDNASVQGLHWRGITLHRFDGVRWTGVGQQSVRTLRPRQDGYAIPTIGRRADEGRTIRYQVALDELPTDVIFVAGEPQQITGSFPVLLRSGSGTYRVPDRPPRGLRYSASSWLVDRERVRPTDVVELFSRRFRRDYLLLPDLDPRIAELASQITEGATNPMERAQSIERYFQTNFEYSLELPDARSDDPLAHFLFERREGHCEYFASAMGVMLRTLGIPSRLVGGFAGGVPNPLTGRHVVRSSDAHAWVDAYIPGYGWLEFDPSPVRPAPPGGMFAQLWMYWDALQASWLEWVVDYDATRQAEIAAGVQERSQSAVFGLAVRWEALSDEFSALMAQFQATSSSLQGIRRLPAGVGALLTSAALFALLFVVRPTWRSWRRRLRMKSGRGNADDARYFFERALSALERRGVKHAPHETGEDVARSLTGLPVEMTFRAVLKSYNAARFGGDQAAEADLPALVRALEACPR